MSDDAPDQGTEERHTDKLIAAQNAQTQEEIDALWAQRRAEETAALSQAENDAYARNHKVIERDEDGNPIDDTEE